MSAAPDVPLVPDVPPVPTGSTAGPTGLTGCTSNNESFELVFRGAGLEEGSGRSNGSDFSADAVVFGAGFARLGRVVWA